MEKVSYANLKLKTNVAEKEIEYGEYKIKVNQYLPIADKYDVIMITLQKAFEDSIYSPIKLDMFFHLHLVYAYTNISFTDKQREDENKLYDTLYSTGLLDKIIEQIPEEEYNILYKYIDEMKDTLTDYKTSLAGIIQYIIQELPNTAQQAAEALKDFNPDTFKNLVSFAKDLNMKN